MNQSKKKASIFRRVFVFPFAIAMLIPLLTFDICLSLYHRIAFGICKMKRVKRSTHFKVDQMRIAQLGKFSRVIAMYICYAKGLMAYASKIFSESDQYWCTPKPVRGRQQMMVDKSKLGVKELKAYKQSQKQKPKRSRKKK